MDDQTIKKHFATLTEQFIAMGSQLAELRASVNVLKVLEAIRMSPADPVEGLKALRQLEEKQQSLDPQAQEAKKYSEMIEALKQWKSGGKHRA